MRTQFTKGPWQVKHSETKPAFNVVGTALGGKYKIARCPYVLTGNESGIDSKEMREAQANARLIAAAPELLEMLQKVYDQINEDRDYAIHFPMSKIKSVIAKAIGEKEEVK